MLPCIEYLRLNQKVERRVTYIDLSHIGDKTLMCTYTKQIGMRVNYCVFKYGCQKFNEAEAQDRCSQLDECGGISAGYGSAQYYLNPKQYTTYPEQHENFVYFAKGPCQLKYSYTITPTKKN